MQKQDLILTLKPADLQWSEDGSLESPLYGDVYFQRKGGREESDYVFLQGNDLKQRFAQLSETSGFNIGELGFGTGLNFLLTASLFLQQAPKGAHLTYVGIEKHPLRPADIERAQALWSDLSSLAQDIQRQYPPLMSGFHHIDVAGGRIRLTLVFGDAAEILPEISGSFDAWYLDGFSPAKNPDMWQEDMFGQIAALTKPGGTLATFSVMGGMRRRFKAEGFDVEKRKGFGIKWSMTTAKKQGAPAPAPAIHKRIAVLGAGIAGCSAAAALALRGCHIDIFDIATQAAQGASGNPVAIIYPKLTEAPSFKGTYHLLSFCRTQALLRHLSLPSWRACGVRHLDMNDEDTGHHHALIEKNGCPPEFMRHDNGLLQPTAGHLSPIEFCSRLLDTPGITKIFGKTAPCIDTLTKNYDAVIIASAHNSKDYAQTSWLPLQALRGQVTFARTTPVSAKLQNVVCHKGYIAPAVDGMHCLGATFQKEEPGDHSTRAEDDIENIDTLAQNMPELGITQQDVAGSRAGYRTTTPDKLPMIGPCPDAAAFMLSHAALRQGEDTSHVPTPYLDKIYLSTGFGAHGIAGAPLAAEILAAEICDEPLPVPQSLMAHLLPERFLRRDLKRRKI